MSFYDFSILTIELHGIDFLISNRLKKKLFVFYIFLTAKIFGNKNATKVTFFRYGVFDSLTEINHKLTDKTPQINRITKRLKFNQNPSPTSSILENVIELNSKHPVLTLQIWGMTSQSY